MITEKGVSYLTIQNIDRLDPLIFKNPVLDDPFKVSNNSRVMQVHISAAVTQDQIVDGGLLQVRLSFNHL